MAFFGFFAQLDQLSGRLHISAFGNCSLNLRSSRLARTALRGYLCSLMAQRRLASLA